MQPINLNDHKPEKKKFDIEKMRQIVLVDYKRITMMSLIAIVLIILFFVASSSFKKSEKLAIQDYNKYQSYLLASPSKEETTKVKTVIIPSETAVDAEKINIDIKNAETYIKTWFTWKTGDEYDAARENVLSIFGEKSVMGKIFVENARTESGNSYVDNFKVNMTVENIKSYPIVINKDGRNDYLSMISVSTNIGNNGSSVYTIMMTYTFDENSNITNAQVYLNNK